MIHNIYIHIYLFVKHICTIILISRIRNRKIKMFRSSKIACGHFRIGWKRIPMRWIGSIIETKSINWHKRSTRNDGTIFGSTTIDPLRFFSPWLFEKSTRACSRHPPNDSRCCCKWVSFRPNTRTLILDRVCTHDRTTNTWSIVTLNRSPRNLKYPLRCRTTTIVCRTTTIVCRTTTIVCRTTTIVRRSNQLG